MFVGALSLSPMQNSGILERQYWANQKNKELWKREKKKLNKEAEKNNQTQLKTTGRNVEGEEKKFRQSSEKYENAALKVSAQN